MEKEKSRRDVRRIYSAVMYCVLALCMVTVVATSLFGMFFNYGSFEVSLPDVSFPSFDVDTSFELPVVNTPSNVPDEESGDESEAPVVTETVYVNPISGGKIVREYSMDALIHSPTMNDYRTHSGIDIASELASPVLAYTDGVVKSIKTDAFMGVCLEIEHSYGLCSYYMNLDTQLPEGIAVGSEVKAGDVIGAVGATAIVEIVDSPHLHFELRVDGKLIDPTNELP